MTTYHLSYCSLKTNNETSNKHKIFVIDSPDELLMGYGFMK